MEGTIKLLKHFGSKEEFWRIEYFPAQISTQRHHMSLTWRQAWNSTVYGMSIVAWTLQSKINVLYLYQLGKPHLNISKQNPILKCIPVLNTSGSKIKITEHYKETFA